MTFRSMAGHVPGNCLLPSGLQVANVWTAGPGVQVENVSAREGGHGTNGSPGP